MVGDMEGAGASGHLALFVMGGSPAILAETLAALAARGDAPDAVQVVTTSHGAALLRRRYFEQGGRDRLVAEWPEYASLVFDEGCIFAPEGVADIACEQDNRRMLGAILDAARDARGSYARITASLAGGRKTMSYYLGLAMNLFGRPQDRLVHVMVPPEWECDRDFLIPPRAEAARIALIDTPYLRLSGLLEKRLREADVATIVRSAQTAIDLAASPPLLADYNERTLRWNGCEVQLPLREFVFYRMFLEQKRRRCAHPGREGCEGCQACYLSAEDFATPEYQEDLHDIRAIYARGPNDPELQSFRKTWSDYEEFKRRLSEIKNQINAKITKAFGFDEHVQQMLVETGSATGDARTCYGIALDRRKIRIER